MKIEIPHAEIEAKWRERWKESGAFRAPAAPRQGKKFYCLDMFPYPSASGLHVGHPEGYTATDILCRYKRRGGFDVLHPMGWDAFGLPAENFALQTGTHPREVTHENIANFKRQIEALGFSYDWDREIDTTDPAYYKWTQWIFLQLFKKGLAYEGVVPINWCPSCKTGLANEEVFEGRCERCGTLVERRDMRQWLLKITAYADRLLSDLEGLDWPESTLAMQRNWIGRSEGAVIRFPVRAPGTPADGKAIEAFTTRPDTLYGATYVVLAPEHPLTAILAAPERKTAVEAYVRAARSKTDLERSALDKEKTGIDTGSRAAHPLTGALLPVWVADYVLAGYGTGAIMAVPAHDERDFDFARKFALPVKQVVQEPPGWPGDKAFCGEGTAVHSPLIDGLPTPQAKAKMIGHLEEKGLGRKAVTYKLRDWVFARQRYWGEPIPIVHCRAHGAVPVPDSALPVLLPDVKDYKPTGTGESPLAAIREWVETPCPKCGEPARRETNTMPQWAGSCWYYLRFIDPRNASAAWDKAKESAWMPVDCYVGGAEHAVLHLLYARFWHKVLFDLGLVSTPEPFQKLRHQGMILSYSYMDAAGNYYDPNQVEYDQNDRPYVLTGYKDIGGNFQEHQSKLLDRQIEKMSKSKKNVVNPDDVINRYGADVFRLYEMFMGPFEDSKPWDARSIEGMSRFLRRVWDHLGRPEAWKEGDGLVRLRHRTIAKVGSDIESMRFNTAISALMIYLNEIQKGPSLFRADAEAFLSLLNPFAPFLTEELWEKSGHPALLAREPWPAHDAALLKDERVEVAVQVNGRVRARMELESGAPEERAREAALALPQIRGSVEGKRVVKAIVVQDKLVNIVVQ